MFVEVPTRISRDQKKKLEELFNDVDLKQYDKVKKYSENVESFYGKKPYSKS